MRALVRVLLCYGALEIVSVIIIIIKIGAKLLLITDRKSHMSFRLVPNSVTLDDLERRNSHIRIVNLPNSIAFGADYVKVVEDTPVLSAAEM